MKDNRGLVAFILIILVTLLIAAFDFWTTFFFDDGKKVSESSIALSNGGVFGSRNRYIAALWIDGVIESENETYNQKFLLDTLKDLKADKLCKGILLHLDTPGGTVYESDELFLALLDYKKVTKNPVWAYQASLCASGGYYISCAADKIFTNRNALTGSIGVIAGSSVDITGLLEKIGVKTKTIHSGKNKNMFNLDEPLTPEQEKIMQAISDEAYEQFVGIVSDSRKLKLSDAKKLSDGRLFTALQAKDAGLIDEIGDYEDATSAMKKECFCNCDYEIIDYQYERPKTIRDLLVERVVGESSAIKAFSRVTKKHQIRYPAYLLG